MNFTADQQKIIDARDCSILVSAAAGSGKTAVMVERIIGLICEEHEDGSDRTDIDRMLIVTFTRAAAAQMREKIATAIEKKLAENPTDTHLQRQSALIANAQITTIDSFCLYVLRNNFSDVNLDPGFRIADEGEIKLLKSDVLAEVIEDYYNDGDEAFLNMAECISTGSEDTMVEEMILKLYEASMSTPWPGVWLEERRSDYCLPENRLDGDWYSALISNVIEQMEALVTEVKSAEKICLLPAGPYMYADQIESDLEQFERCLEKITANPKPDYDSIASFIDAIEYKTLSRKSDPSVDALLRDKAKSIRDGYKAKQRGILSKFFFQTEASHIAQMQVCNAILGTLVDVTLEFMRRLDEKKREKGILSFADCEHLALNVLVRRTDDGWEYTETAAEYRKYFDYVMIDEYQDSNNIQELLLSAVSGESEGNYNRFMVGDVKQSIYRFRKAQPKIFMDKYEEYENCGEGEKNKLLVDLHQNFRSRSAVLDLVNSICETLMSKSVGDVVYDDRAALHIGAQYKEDTEGLCEAEFLVYDKANEEGLDAQEVEARGIALRIEQLMSSEMLVREGDDPANVRKLRYGDIVILLRKATGYTEIFSKALAERGIPVHVSGIAGYFDTYEIKTILQLLKIIVNPLQDISFYGVMSSIIGGFDASEIARIRIAYADKLDKNEQAYLYEACKYVAGADGCSSLRDKVVAFLEMLDKYRVHSEYMGAEELLCEILRDTDYRTVMYAMKDGEKRLANIDMLMKKASDYAKTSYFGLYNFLRYVDMVQKFEITVPESETIDENADVVRIMTIHKSKGLEFPVCFVSGLGGKFNDNDYTSAFVIDGDMGFGMSYIDIDRRIKSDNLRRNAVADKIKRETFSEELRILYVALTRAKEKLILTGVGSKVGDKIAKLQAVAGDRNSIPISIRAEDKFLNWIFLAMVYNGYGEEAIVYIDDCLGRMEYKDNCDEEDVQEEPLPEKGIVDMPKLNMSFSFFADGEIQLEDACAAVDRHMLRKQLELMVPENDEHKPFDVKETDVIKYLRDLYTEDYSHHELDGLITKVSVSDLKHRAIEERQEGTVDANPDPESSEKVVFDSDKFREPQFISHSDSKSGATERGSAFHRAMELVDFASFVNELGEQLCEKEAVKNKLSGLLDGFATEGKIPKNHRAILKGKTLDVLSEIFDTDVMKRMALATSSGKMYKEAPFMLGIPASDYKPEFPADEVVMIQGIIDAYWEEDDGIVILDYKTDRVSCADELVDRYQTQLDWYERALERMNLKVKEKLIYSFALNETISL